MNSDPETLRLEVNGKLDELNGYLVEANVEPVTKLAVKDSDAGTASSSVLRQTLDYLDMPLHVDSRAEKTLAAALKRLELLETLEA